MLPALWLFSPVLLTLQQLEPSQRAAVPAEAKQGCLSCPCLQPCQGLTVPRPLLYAGWLRALFQYVAMMTSAALDPIPRVPLVLPLAPRCTAVQSGGWLAAQLFTLPSATHLVPLLSEDNTFKSHVL